ncbi:MAG: hypothetical protein U5K51_12700 [Flavobacteriaceae bacterium]|nr:hypothetical protein [Flavobacteriaceae bacterium]
MKTRLEQKKIKKYAKSLIEDLKSDIAMLEVSHFQADKKYKAIDSLRAYFSQTSISELSNTNLFILSHDIMYRPYFWNRSTLNELKNSGGLSYISNDSLLKKLVAYESFSQHLDEDFQFDKSNSEKGDGIVTLLFYLTLPILVNW